MVLCSDWVQGTLLDSTKPGIGGTPLMLHHVFREDPRTSLLLATLLSEGTLTFSSSEQFGRRFPPEGIQLLSARWSGSWEVLQGSILTLSWDPALPYVFWSPPSHFTLWLPGSTRPPGHCSPKLSLVITQMLSEAIAEHHAKQLVQKEYSANLLCQKAKKKKTNTFVWLHSCKSWLLLFWTVFGLVSSHISAQSSSPWVTRAYVATSTTIKMSLFIPQETSLYLHNYPEKHSRARLCDQLHCTQ